MTTYELNLSELQADRDRIYHKPERLNPGLHAATLYARNIQESKFGRQYFWIWYSGKERITFWTSTIASKNNKLGKLINQLGYMPEVGDTFQVLLIKNKKGYLVIESILKELSST